MKVTRPKEYDECATCGKADSRVKEESGRPFGTSSFDARKITITCTTYPYKKVIMEGNRSGTIKTRRGDINAGGLIAKRNVRCPHFYK